MSLSVCDPYWSYMDEPVWAFPYTCHMCPYVIAIWVPFGSNMDVPI